MRRYLENIGTLTDLQAGRHWPARDIGDEVLRRAAILAGAGVERGSIVVIAHGDYDLRHALQARPREEFDRFAGFGVISEYLQQLSAELGIKLTSKPDYSEMTRCATRTGCERLAHDSASALVSGTWRRPCLPPTPIKRSAQYSLS